MANNKNTSLALALSGGAARCIAHIGVLQALEDAGLTVDAVAGTSGGSLVGAMYLDGMPLDGMARLAARTGWTALFRPALSRRGLFSSVGVYRFAKRHLGAEEISDLPKPFAAVCADLVTGEKVAITEGPLAKAVQASCSLPVLFTPTQFLGRTLVDGGYVSQIPVLAAKEELGAKIVVAVDVNYKSNRTPRLTNMVGISLHLTEMFARRNAVAEVPHADAVISVDISGIRLFDIAKHAELLERGRRAAAEKVKDIKDLLGSI